MTLVIKMNCDENDVFISIFRQFLLYSEINNNKKKTYNLGDKKDNKKCTKNKTIFIFLGRIT